MKTIEQIALETAQEMGLIANSVYEAFAKQFLAAWLAQQEPVAWISNESKYRLKHGGNSKGTVPVHLMRSCASKIPLFLAPPPAVMEWQPIATAPKDEFVLLRGPSGYTTIPFVCTTGRMCSEYHKGRWIDHANDDLTDWGFEPTYWMPLPQAPKGEQE